MSTPAGKFKLVRASITFGFGLKMSINRLCVRISYCSRASLCTNEDRFTVYFRMAVGRGTGPTNSHPCLSTVSIICLQEASMTLWSYAEILILSFCCVPFSPAGVPRPPSLGEAGCEAGWRTVDFAIVFLKFPLGTKRNPDQRDFVIFTTV